MKKLIIILFPIYLLACESSNEQVIIEPPGPIEPPVIEEKEKSAQVYLDTYPFLGNVLLVDEPNIIVVHLTDVNSEELIIEMGEETLDIDKYGNIQYTPKKVGEIYLNVFIMSDGLKIPRGKTMFRVMSAETTLGEVYAE